MSTKNNHQNLNSIWADLIIEELRRSGVEYFCVAPGSRSAPLALAVARNSKIKSVVHYDERGLGFYALGITSATLKPTAVITTSGTAAANLFPSIIEASKKKLPLVILTADRPPELRATGANQTIDQVKIYGDYVRFFFDLPCPTTQIPPEMVLSTIDQAISRTRGELPGPVHINCMFREPLAPHLNQKDYSSYLTKLKKWQNNNERPYTVYPKLKTVLSDSTVLETAQILNSVKNGIIAIGKISGDSDKKAIFKLIQKLNWPVFADVTSGLRLGCNEKQMIHRFDHILSVKGVERKIPVDGVLHLGGRLTSSRWLNFVKKAPIKNYVMVLKHPLRNDPQHVVTLRLQSSASEFCKRLASKINNRKPSNILKRLQKFDQISDKVFQDHFSLPHEPLTETHIARILTEIIPQNSGLFIGNSMPIRELNLFANSNGKTVYLTANRGASGIDGNIASAAGFATGLAQPCTAIIGDLTFLYDLNSLSLLKDAKRPFVLIVVNNNGGAIFSFLPVAQATAGFDKFFTTPHHLTFAHAAMMFGHSYNLSKTQKEFTAAYTKAIHDPKVTIIELIVSAQDTLKTHFAIQKKLHRFYR